MNSTDDIIRTQQERLESLEQEKIALNRMAHEEENGERSRPQQVKEKLDRINQAIEETYSQISLCRIRKLMGFF